VILRMMTITSIHNDDDDDDNSDETGLCILPKPCNTRNTSGVVVSDNKGMSSIFMSFLVQSSRKIIY